MVKILVSRGYLKPDVVDKDGNKIEEGGFVESPTGMLFAAKIEGVDDSADAVLIDDYERIGQMIVRMLEQGMKIQEGEQE